MRAAAIVPAAGQGVRMHAPGPKALIPLLGKPILAWTLEAVAQSNLFSEILVACPPGEEKAFRNSVNVSSGGADMRFIAGGMSRQQSVLNCIANISSGCELVAVHDGARPLVTEKLLRDTLQKAAQTGAAIAAVPCKDTVKLCDERGIIIKTLQRERLRLVQTPQCFHYDILKKAYEKALQDDFSATDDSAIVEHLGIEVHVVEGSYENMKVTTPGDIIICEQILKGRQCR